MKYYRYLFLKYLCCIFTLLFFFNHCAKKSRPEETFIARIGDKSISKQEFIKRAEYTIRPPYCRSDNYVHRKIVLNSLIAEKLFALEAGENNELTQNAEFQTYLRGRKEQAMREWFYYQDIYSQVKPDANEIKQYYRFAGRTYKVRYLGFNDSTTARKVHRELIEQKKSFQSLAGELGDSLQIPEQEIRYDQPENDALHLALFSDSLRKGQVLGPLEMDKDFYMLVEIKGWNDEVAITDQQMQQRWNTVSDKIKDIKAAALSIEYVKDLMRGKKVIFERDTFVKLVNIIGPEYFKSEQEKQQAFNKKLWNKDSDEMILDNLGNQMDQILDRPLLTLDGETWRVADLQEAIQSHPLVFRKRKMVSREFAEQFKLAIVDLIRDQYITREAYNKGYDQEPAVQRNLNMWRDNLLALYQRDQYLKKIQAGRKDPLNVIEKYLDPYAQELFKKYNNEIEISTDEFEKLKLTSIDMFVVQRNVPFPVAVPSFPQFTTYDKLDYGRRMELKKGTGAQSLPTGGRALRH